MYLGLITGFCINDIYMLSLVSLTSQQYLLVLSTYCEPGIRIQNISIIGYFLKRFLKYVIRFIS